jgi:TolB-like protein/Flp pilus assembly protein TadD
MSGFFEEVQRRKVYRVAVAYVVAAGGIIQLASATFPAWELPTWSLRLVISLLLLGFPIALIVAWAFDVTPEGIQRTPRAETARPGRTRRNIAILCAVGLAISVVAGSFILPRASARKVDKSIAVLPFENLSTDKDNAFFADGLQDDILTNLAKIGELKVISRTSVMAYRGRPGSVRDIGRELGVGAVLEGSVRKEGNRIRLNVQLIDTRTDEHIWAEDYDRDLVDVFAIQTDLAEKVAEELRAKLSPSEKAQLSRKPTENGEAYLAFFQARNLYVPEDNAKLLQSEQLYERAIKLDANFALAYAAYSQLESWIYRSFDPQPARRDRARALADRALQLQPDLPEGHLARGFVLYYGEQNYGAALKEFEIAQRGLPNESEAYLALGAIQRRQGRWAESTVNLEKAATLNPKATWPLQNVYFNYQMTRDFVAAEKTLDRALAVEPDSFPIWDLKAKLAYAARGDTGTAAEAVRKFQTMPPEVVEPLKRGELEFRLAFAQRRFEDALRMLETLPDEVIGKVPGGVAQKYLAIGDLKQRLGDEAAARAALLKAREGAEAQVRLMPDNAIHRIWLAKALALLGEKEAARAEIGRAMELLPESKDAFNGPDVTQGAAEVFAVLGERDRALALLEHLISRPSSVTVQVLKNDPAWDALRGEPRFQALIEKYAAAI